jgi:major membrane immunogen (membrane-anchored lipoprotein)
MNERVKELAEQALNEYSATYHNEAKIPEAYLKKFAELIVERLCYDMMDVCGATQAERIQFVAKDWGVEL